MFIERASRRGLVGNLYKGRVTRVLPGMQAAFLQIGLARTGFLHVADILGAAAGSGNDCARDDAAREVPDIRTLVREGDELLVQVVKDPLGTKGARLSTQVSLPSRYLVYMPRASAWGCPSRIPSVEAREQLRSIVTRLAGEARRAAVATSCAPRRWMHRPTCSRPTCSSCTRLWTHVRERALATPAGNLVHEDLPLTTARAAR